MNLQVLATRLAALGLLAISFASQAADIPRPVYRGEIRPMELPYYNWSGFYLGINGGYAWGTSGWTVAPVNVLDAKPTGWLVGLTAGYNLQFGSVVVGIEADYDWADIKSSDTCAAVFVCGTKSSYLATVRGRLGYAFDRFLPYVSGGAAVGDIRADIPLVALSSRSHQVGWTVGGGLEYGFAGNWSAKLEYLYVDLGSFDSGFVAPLAAANIDFKDNIVRAGLNYRFSGPLFARF
jgi:outer membrane immunogenic protein